MNNIKNFLLRYAKNKSFIDNNDGGEELSLIHISQGRIVTDDSIIAVQRVKEWSRWHEHENDDNSAWKIGRKLLAVESKDPNWKAWSIGNDLEA